MMLASLPPCNTISRHPLPNHQSVHLKKVGSRLHLRRTLKSGQPSSSTCVNHQSTHPPHRPPDCSPSCPTPPTPRISAARLASSTQRHPPPACPSLCPASPLRCSSISFHAACVIWHVATTTS